MKNKYYHAADIMATVWAITILLTIVAIALVFSLDEVPFNMTVPVIILMVGMLSGVFLGYLLGEIAYEEPPIKILKKGEGE